MPSIEIICEGQKEPANLKDMPFAVITETELKSHRSPSHFQEEFDTLQGCIYHLGNPDLKKDEEKGAFFAYELLSETSRSEENGELQFGGEFKTSIQKLMGILIKQSHCGRIIFTTDWQFGPEKYTDGGELKFSEFWKLYEAGELKLNGIYRLTE